MTTRMESTWFDSWAYKIISLVLAALHRAILTTSLCCFYLATLCVAATSLHSTSEWEKCKRRWSKWASLTTHNWIVKSKVSHQHHSWKEIRLYHECNLQFFQLVRETKSIRFCEWPRLWILFCYVITLGPARLRFLWHSLKVRQLLSFHRISTY